MTGTREPNPDVRLAWRILLPLEAASFFIGALLHSGISLGPLSEPRIVEATVVESLCGAGLAIAAWAQSVRHSSWRGITVGAQAFALGGVLLGWEPSPPAEDPGRCRMTSTTTR